jgi:hypothetical protein
MFQKCFYRGYAHVSGSTTLCRPTHPHTPTGPPCSMNISHPHLHKVVFLWLDSNKLGNQTFRTPGTWHRVLVWRRCKNHMVSPSHCPFNACYIPNHLIVLRCIMSSRNTVADNTADVTLVNQPVGTPDLDSRLAFFGISLFPHWGPRNSSGATPPPCA